jgi:phosphoribosylcarboxyaminoimidazole (NCAIR) mutase
MGIRLTKTATIVSFSGMIISAALFVYGCVRIFDQRVESGITEIFVGGLGFASSKILHDIVRAGRLSEDPVFGRPCYLETSSSSSSSVEIPAASIVPGSETNRSANATLPIERIESSEII